MAEEARLLRLSLMERSITDEVLYDRYRYLDLHSHLQHLHGHELKSAGACNRALWLRSDAVTIQVPTTTAHGSGTDWWMVQVSWPGGGGLCKDGTGFLMLILIEFKAISYTSL
ncbi:hypothetical protein M419DRAFT_129090 [Trichoderma reesei RUT C-30]|uniref:Uncharacterized protein n=1 Tax=Hypocrea jecorina (strain ATCC 56765 / BCRC 32924 / NRRL 11460 / Rut C-30) TaxID=1344414 RepID=A0A024SFI3_HYPJR|nr:hypothetical protein M419DRAFT_129090 [Trichoderma reesei RUT C-30]